MPRLKPALLTIAAVVFAALALVLAVRLGSTAWPVICLFALLALTCVLRLLTLHR